MCGIMLLKTDFDILLWASAYQVWGLTKKIILCKWKEIYSAINEWINSPSIFAIPLYSKIRWSNMFLHLMTNLRIETSFFSPIYKISFYIFLCVHFNRCKVCSFFFFTVQWLTNYVLVFFILFILLLFKIQFHSFQNVS